MKKTTLLLAGVLSAAAATTAQNTNETTTAQNTIVISATRIETSVEQLAGTANIITAENLENSKKTSVTEVLRTVPGISISRTGGPGQSSSIYLRGAKPQHTLILIDGVRMNGQLDLSGYDLTHLQTFDIERIEVLKGPQSTLYGSDAMAGVINIITKKGNGKPTPYYELEGGSYGTWRAATGISGGDDQVNYTASLSHFDRQGESAKADNTEKDGTVNDTASARIGVTPSDSSSLDFTVRYVNATSDYDDGYFENEQLVTRASARSLLLDDLLETQVGVSYLILDSETFSAFPGSFNSDTLSADWQNTIYLHENHTVLAGIDWHRDWYEFSDGTGDLDNLGLFATYQIIPLRNGVATIGIRNDEHSEFGNKTTYQASTAYRITPTRTKLKASWGTGFKAPTSFQLYSSYGDPALQPETSTGWEAGFEQQILTNRLEVGAVYFNNVYEDLIDYNFATFTYGNISMAESVGVEVYTSAKLLENLNLRIGYTYLDNDDKSTDAGFEIRRPQHKVDLDLNYAATEKLNLNLNASYSGSRDDLDFSTYPSTLITLDPYTLVNLAVRYQATQNVQLYGRIDNLLNEDYQTANGYNQDNIAAYAGVKVTL